MAQSAVEVRIADESGQPLAVGTTGEILVRGDSVMRGYWRNPEASAKALRDGWLHTGDVGVVDDDGFLTLKDRSKDVIISGGSNIYPREVEEVLFAHPRCSEACVIGRPHFGMGRGGRRVQSSDARRHSSRGSARWRCVSKPRVSSGRRSYRFVAALPKNKNGKILKREIRDWLAEEAPPE